MSLVRGAFQSAIARAMGADVYWSEHFLLKLAGFGTLLDVSMKGGASWNSMLSTIAQVFTEIFHPRYYGDTAKTDVRCFYSTHFRVFHFYWFRYSLAAGLQCKYRQCESFQNFEVI